MSLELQGLGVSKGIAIGHAHILFHNQPTVDEYVIASEDIEAEVVRLENATQCAKDQLHSILSSIPSNAPTDISSFIDTHLLMLQDSSLSKVPVEMVRQRRCNAEWALQLQRDALINVFDEMDDPYLRTRRDDVNHVIDRIHYFLAHKSSPIAPGQNNRLKGAIIIAHDLTPADTILMQNQGVIAFVTEHGGATSHTTILARSLGIPAIVSIGSLRRYIQDNEALIIDGGTGVLIAGASNNTLQEYQRYHHALEQHIASLSKYKSIPTKTRDNKLILLQANADSPEDVSSIHHSGAEGIGLYRTEFLYMNRLSPPDEEEQLIAYRKVVEGMNNQSVTIRTFDLGADKKIERNQSQHNIEANPALGLRAIRLSLKQPKIFRTQLRAILRASAFGKVKIMFPMVSNINEFQQAKDILQQCKLELTEQNIAFDQNIDVGVMIEIPSSAICADLFAEHADFLSIGTNDLIQYTLAIDRINELVNYLYDPLHPAVLRLIQITIDAGKKYNIPVSMCGEMAGDSRYTLKLLAMGLNNFSIHPKALLEIKQIINESSFQSLSEQSLDNISTPEQRSSTRQPIK